ncbi:hypothetical protein SAMN04488056_11267 [Cohaesibacter marisflavi]|uniref:Uncharacterized protein n=1 Tax=Cohaesibacter marisflavi TaxID=655353 RepID=A0A1I5JSI1_9HYPH|nr:hypothetical protein SAMN04488056_11267 [Cohaesibacter marisflavi]
MIGSLKPQSVYNYRGNSLQVMADLQDKRKLRVHDGVRYQMKWYQSGFKVREHLSHLVVDTMRRFFGEASAFFSSVSCMMIFLCLMSVS